MLNDIFSRLDTIDERDGRRQRQRLRTASRGKNCSTIDLLSTDPVALHMNSKVILQQTIPSDYRGTSSNTGCYC